MSYTYKLLQNSLKSCKCSFYLILACFTLLFMGINAHFRASMLILSALLIASPSNRQGNCNFDLCTVGVTSFHFQFSPWFSGKIGIFLQEMQYKINLR